MTNVLWRRGIHPGTMPEARAYYSGGVVSPRFDTLAVSKRLEDNGLSAYQFCYYVSNYVKEEPFAVDTMLYKNTLDAPYVWESFLSWRGDLPRYLRVQREIVKDVIKGSLTTMPLRSILVCPTLEISPVYRLEYALITGDTCDVDKEEMLDKYAEKSGRVLLGLPEMLEYAPALAKELEDENAVRRCFPAQTGRAEAE